VVFLRLIEIKFLQIGTNYKIMDTYYIFWGIYNTCTDTYNIITDTYYIFNKTYDICWIKIGNSFKAEDIYYLFLVTYTAAVIGIATIPGSAINHGSFLKVSCRGQFSTFFTGIWSTKSSNGAV
jgi:hypothetical protein